MEKLTLRREPGPKLNLMAVLELSSLAFITMCDQGESVHLERSEFLIWVTTPYKVERGVVNARVSFGLMEACKVRMGDKWDSTYGIQEKAYRVMKEMCDKH